MYARRMRHACGKTRVCVSVKRVPGHSDEPARRPARTARCVLHLSLFPLRAQGNILSPLRREKPIFRQTLHPVMTLFSRRDSRDNFTVDLSRRESQRSCADDSLCWRLTLLTLCIRCLSTRYNSRQVFITLLTSRCVNFVYDENYLLSLMN